MKTETLQFETANGTTTAFAALPDKPDSTKTVILVHEWWGLNENIKSVAKRYADEGFVAVAPDLYRGSVAANPEDAAKLMNGLAIEDGLNTIASAMKRVRAEFGTPHFGISGYCMGGTFALRAACELEGINAAAPYYGDIPDESILRQLTVPVVFVSGIHDKWITPEKVAALENAAEKFKLPVESLKYDADHAFSNSTRAGVYNEEAAEDAWAKVIRFFDDNL